MAVEGEKLGMDPRIGQMMCGGLGREPFFSEAVDPFNSVNDSWNVATYEDCPQEAYEWRTWTNVESVRVVCIRFPLQGVHRFESPRLSDMSNRLSSSRQHVAKI
jgi:hypothetical protein